ncbi:hypothetical protein E2C01_093876 [Portunus trituberculatus]|uniref:Uncharacterized protein n=1 Tax=Portunus trituberculatus TaxID=210409 RepID=A0A5B7JVN9_PORTR|nr:hypothetical protein [Portunus trituberculatus]
MERKIDTMGARKGADSPSSPSPSLTGPEPFVSGSQAASSGSEGCSLTRSVSSVESYSSNSDKFGNSSDKRSYTLDRYGSGLDRFTSTSDKLTSALDKFGSSSVKFGSETERSKSLPEKYSIDLGISQFGLGGEISGLTFRTGLEKHVSGLERSNSSPAKYLSPDKREKTSEQLDFLTETHKFGCGNQEGPDTFKSGKENTETASELNHIGYGIENRQKPNLDKEKAFTTEKHGYGYENRTRDMENGQYGLEKEGTASGPGLATSRPGKNNGEEIEREKMNYLSHLRKEGRMTSGGEMEGKIVLLRACLDSLREVEGKVEELEESGGKEDRWEREERDFTCDSLINVFERVVRVLGEV